jgi:hypothetical protein
MALALYISVYFLFLAFRFLFLPFSHAELLSSRIKGEDEPQLLSYRVLEGVTEPFDTSRGNSKLPAWQQVNNILRLFIFARINRR